MLGHSMAEKVTIDSFPFAFCLFQNRVLRDTPRLYQYARNPAQGETKFETSELRHTVSETDSVHLSKLNGIITHAGEKSRGQESAGGNKKGGNFNGGKENI
jgi:hypothetical protein